MRSVKGYKRRRGGTQLTYTESFPKSKSNPIGREKLKSVTWSIASSSFTLLKVSHPEKKNSSRPISSKIYQNFYTSQGLILPKCFSSHHKEKKTFRTLQEQLLEFSTLVSRHRIIYCSFD